MSESAELLPCPFCDGNASIADFHHKWFVSCADNDACPAYVMNTPYATQREAIAAWNTRHTAPASEAEGLLQAAIGLRDDLVMRAKANQPDAQQVVVAAGNGAWFRFNQALDRLINDD